MHYVMNFKIYFCLCDIQNCSHTLFFLDPESFLCLSLLLSWLFFFFLKYTQNLLLLPSSSVSPPPQSFFFFYVCQVFALLERVTTLTSVSQLAAKSHTSLSLNPYSCKKPKCFYDTPPNVVAVLCLAQPKLSETQHPLPRSLPLKKWFL